MPAGSRKSGTLRKVFVRTPGSNVTVHHRKKKPTAAKCGWCSAVLKGVPRERPIELKKTAKTSRRPERPFGGVLCSACARKHIVAKARSE